MPLRFALNAFDELHIGKCVIKNSHERSSFLIEGRVPILQGRDYLEPEKATSALENFYCCLQKIYLEEAYEEHQGAYLAGAARSLSENPSLALELQIVDQLVTSGDHFRALRALKKLIGSQPFKKDKTAPESYVPRVNGWKKAI